MFDGYFAREETEENYEELLLIDVKTMRPWILTREVKYKKKINMTTPCCKCGNRMVYKRWTLHLRKILRRY